MKAVFKFFILSSLVLWSLPGASQVLLKETLTTSSDAIHLSEVADLSAVKAELKEKLGSIQLYSGLKPGQKVEIPASELSRIIRRAMADLSIPISDRPLYRLPQSLALRRGVPLTSASFSSRLESDLHEICTGCKIEIQDAKLPPELIQKSCQIWSWKPEELKAKPHQIISLQTQCPELKTYQTSVQIKIYRKGAVSLSALSTMTSLSPNEIKTDWVDVSFAQESPLEVSQVVGRKLRRRLKASSPVFKSDLVQEYDVQKGRLTKIIVGQDPLQISSMAIAEQNGVVGEFVRLKHPSTGKILSGQVDESGTVRIE